MRLQVIKNWLFKWFKKTIHYGAYFFLILFLLSVILLQLPVTQRTILSRFTSKISQVSGFKISYDRIFLIWWDRLEVNNLSVIDPENNTMIYVGSLQANFKLSSLLLEDNINLDGVILDAGSVNLVTITESDTSRILNISKFIDEINKLYASDKPSQKSAGFNIGEIVIHTTNFSLHEPLKDTVNNLFDVNHIQIHIDEAQAQHFKVLGDTIELKLNSMIASEENARLPIHNLSTFFRISQGGMEFYNLQAKIGESTLSDTLVFKYEGMEALSDFNSKVNIQAKLKNTLVHPDDLAKFASGNILFDKPITLNGKISGRISRLMYQQMDVQVGNTQLNGKLELDGLPSINETFINLDVKNGNVNIYDLKFLFPDNVFDRLKTLGNFRFTGKFTGFTNDFVADGDFRGVFGQIKSDINLKIDEKSIDRSTFEGNLSLNDFDLGQFFNDTTTFQKVTLTGRIKGKGLNKETADFTLAGQISSIGIRKYNYKNINTDARFAKEFFSGQLTIDDPNVQLAANGSLNIRKGEEVIKISAQLDTLFTHNLGLTKKRFFVKSDVELDTKGLKLDSLFGKIVLRNTFLNYEDETLALDSVYLNSFIDSSNLRNLNLQSSYVDVLLKGNFYYTALFSDIQKLINEFKLNVTNNKQELLEYYRSKPKELNDYSTSFSINLRHITPVLKLLKTGVTVSDNTLIKGNFFNGYTSGLQAYSEIDSVSYAGKYFIGNELDFSGSKISDSTAVLAMLTVQSEKQIISSALTTSKLFTEAIWDSDHIDLNVDAEQEGTSNYISLQSEIDFLADSTKIKILPTKIRLLEKEWTINQNNYILNKGKEWMVYQLGLNHLNETLLLDGALSENKDASLRLFFNNLNLDILNSLSASKFKGILNGSIESKDVYHDFYLQNDLTIKDLEVDNFLIGNIIGTNTWNQEEKVFDINFTIDRLEKRTLTLQGNYNPGKSNPLNVTATLEKTNIKIIEPFLKGIFSQMDGTLSGLYNIKGTFTAPLIEGEGKIEGGKIMIDYLKTLYSFSGNLRMTPNSIFFEDFNMQDALNNKGYLDGYLAHRNFKKFRINLDAIFTNFQVLNTTAKDNSLFYGQAYGTGKLNMFGPLDNMKISSTARTSKNTKIYIPISGTESVKKSEYIKFISLTDSAQTALLTNKLKTTKELTGITLDLNLDITPDAYAEIIFDIVAGDIIRGYGNGDIKLQLDTKGEFNMFGLFEFESGNYNFTLYDIINKEFNIAKGSRISWYGDPYTGVLNVNANYRQLASLAPILENQVSENALTSPQVRRKYPIDVNLKLDGPMLSPQIQFDILAKDLPEYAAVEGEPPVRLNFQFSVFKAKLDEQELKRQVFSLIVLRKFSPMDAFSTSGSITNSVSEFLSNQLSYWLTQVDENLEINIDLGAMDQEAFNTFQLRLSYSFLGGRLKVTRDGTFSNEPTNTNMASMLGDWTIDYLLTPDGKLKVKFFSRSNFNSTTTNAATGAQTAVTTGVSLLHTQNFNQVKDLLRGSRDKRRSDLDSNPLSEEAIIEENENYD